MRILDVQARAQLLSINFMCATRHSLDGTQCAPCQKIASQTGHPKSQRQSGDEAQDDIPEPQPHLALVETEPDQGGAALYRVPFAYNSHARPIR